MLQRKIVRCSEPVMEPINMVLICDPTVWTEHDSNFILGAFDYDGATFDCGSFHG